MPEIQSDGLDVSAEEERYLRRVFRRFAAPYLLVGLVLATLVIGWSSFGPASAGGTPDPELETLVAEAASLREALATLRTELREQSDRSTRRIDALEGGIDRLKADVGGESVTELGSRLDHAHQRINAVEGRLEQIESVASARQPAPPSPARVAEPWPPASPSRP